MARKKNDIPAATVVDFESWGIEDRPRYPPCPCGVSVKEPGKPSRYYAFGHISGNNCDWGTARAAVAKAYANPHGVVFQNGKFDTDLAEVWFGLAPPPPLLVHDTMFLLFLDDPHQSELGLKESAERLLGQPPEEKGEVVEWLVANQPVPNVKISRSKQSPHYAMKYLPFAPGGLVGRYANGDTDRTWDLFALLYPKTVSRGMLAAYQREQRLMPILLKMERRGLLIDLPRLRKDVKEYSEWATRLDAWLLKYLKVGPELNLDSGEQLMDAMAAAGKVDLSVAERTKTGKLASNKDALLIAVSDPVLLGLLRYRAALKTSLGTFMGPWLAMAEATGGTIHTTWHQVRQIKGGDTSGTRTGRLSATWFMNMPKEFKDAREGVRVPKALDGLPALPNCRGYIIPGKGRVFIDRDWSQQEPRLLAHFEGGALMKQYQANPWLDLHDNARDELAKVGKVYDRKPVKNTNLGLIYGMGVGKLALKNDMTVVAAKGLKEAILHLYPGLKEMYSDMKRRARVDEPIRTWGGREIYCEPARVVEGKMRQFDYKLVNMLIQGSGADVNKEAVIRFDDAITAAGSDWWLVLDVHDQLTASVPVPEARGGMEVMQKVMEDIELDVPLLSEGAVSATNWAELVDVDKKGKELPWPRLK